MERLWSFTHDVNKPRNLKSSQLVISAWKAAWRVTTTVWIPLNVKVLPLADKARHNWASAAPQEEVNPFIAL